MKLEKYLTEGTTIIRFGGKDALRLQHETYEEEQGINYGAQQVYEFFAEIYPEIKKKYKMMIR